MANEKLLAELSDIKRRVSELGIEYLESQMPISLSDVGLTLRPFTAIDTTLNCAIKKFNSDKTGSIPKSNTLSK